MVRLTRARTVWLVCVMAVALVACSAGQPCPPLTTTCGTGALIGQIRGDIGNDSVDARGPAPAWLLLDVYEGNSTAYGAPMTIVATLTSPPGTQFRLSAYAETRAYNTDGGPPAPTADGGLLLACDRIAATSDASSSLTLSWGESTTEWANGVEDGRRVAFVIEHVSGDCPDGATWHLVVSHP